MILKMLIHPKHDKGHLSFVQILDNIYYFITINDLI